MRFAKVPTTTLETIIEGLEDAIKVCYNVDSSSDDCEKSYPYAVGYSKAAMKSVIERLNQLKSQAN